MEKQKRLKKKIIKLYEADSYVCIYYKYYWKASRYQFARVEN